MRVQKLDSSLKIMFRPHPSELTCRCMAFAGSRP